MGGSRTSACIGLILVLVSVPVSAGQKQVVLKVVYKNTGVSAANDTRTVIDFLKAHKAG